MQKEIEEVLKYFAQFSYAPSLDEIYTFLPVKVTKEKLRQEFKKYTLPQYSNFLKKKAERKRYSQNKIKKISTYLKILSFFPQIKLIGLSGTMAMDNAEKDDDIDLFIIAAKKRLWTARFISLVIAQVLGLRSQRGETKDKVCLNLFFDEGDMEVPDSKKTFFVGHEILQMKPLIDKNCIYARFLWVNRWVFKMFPNAKRNLKFKIQNLELKSETAKTKPTYYQQFVSQSWLWSIIELFLRLIQLPIIKRNKTGMRVSETQLWLFRKDFEKEIKR